MQKSLSKKLIWATFLGNIIEHYDKALFGLIAPFIAPLFFPKSDPITALILIYLPLGLIARPLGALYWGKMGDHMGRKQVLYFSILGMSLTIILTGLLPTYKSIGVLSAVLLHLQRGLTCFFAAGEGTGASLLLIENAEEKSKDLMSSLYESSTMIGIFIASLLITFFCFQNTILLVWRYLFVISGFLGMIGFWFRKSAFKERLNEDHFKNQNKASWISLIKSNKLSFTTIVVVTGFSYANYHILTKLMNGYLPLVSKISYKEMMLTHSFLILLDALMLPLFGYISKKVGKEKLILTALLSALFLVFPLFLILKKPTTLNVLFIRMIMVTWGIALAAPFSYWTMTLVSQNQRFRFISLAKAFGAQWIGAPAISISLILSKWTNSVFSPAIYIFFTALISSLFFFALIYLKKRETQKI